jgi:hypothetical protein
VVQSTISDVERGRGASLSLDVWHRTFLALDRDLHFDATRDPRQEPADAGHLAVQELILRLARASGRAGSFELPTKPSEAWRSTDVCIRDDGNRALILVECWNTLGDVGAAARSTNRKLAEADALAAAVTGQRPYRVTGCWVLRATKRNRELVTRYPELFNARFPGSSSGWVRALQDGAAPPEEIGLLWTDVASTRLFPWRRRPTR